MKRMLHHNCDSPCNSHFYLPKLLLAREKSIYLELVPSEGQSQCQSTCHETLPHIFETSGHCCAFQVWSELERMNCYVLRVRGPLITTSIGVEGSGLKHGKHILVADNAEEIAEQITNIFSDSLLWHRLSQNGKHFFDKNFSFQDYPAKSQEMRRLGKKYLHNSLFLLTPAPCLLTPATAKKVFAVESFNQYIRK